MASQQTDLLKYVLEYRSKGVSQSFEGLLEKHLNIGPGIRQRAGTSQRSVREFLDAEHTRDAGFPAILKNSDCDFIGGSFGRHTKIWPLDDIDIYLPLEGSALYYTTPWGAFLPYTVASDEHSLYNPLLADRWATGGFVSSSKLIEGFTKVLKRHFSTSVVKPDKQAVAVRMTQGAGTNSEGLGYDIVPCFSLTSNTSTTDRFYLIPDGHGGWIRTNPRLDSAMADLLQKQHQQTFRKVVKLIKYWNASVLNGELSSYYIELAVARTYCSRLQSIEPLSFGLALGFWSLNEAVVKGPLQSWVPEAPLVSPGTLSQRAREMLQIASHYACAAWDHEKMLRFNSAATTWKQLFGDELPD